MRINDTFEIRRENKTCILYENGIPYTTFDPEALEALYKKLLINNPQDKSREDILDEFFKTNGNTSASSENTNPIKVGLEKLINFFTEFNFTPSFRFVNTFVRSTDKSKYVADYFALMGSPYADDIAAKVLSREFGVIVDKFNAATSTQTINKRFRIYYGAQGTGKTTQALKETNNSCIVCNSAMLPNDLLEDFTFDDGKATFHPSILVRCMEEGLPITMDEINLLPFESLRFLQGIFDGKTEFQYKGNTIHINDGFKVIGTMNLSVNGVVFGLPEPLVDRCETIKEYVLNAEMLMRAI